MGLNSNTPQTTYVASADNYVFTESELLSSGLVCGNVVTLNVLSNDSAGLSIYSIDDASGSATTTAAHLQLDDLKKTALTSAWETTTSGDRIRIVNGKIELDISASLARYGASSISALDSGEVITVSFAYAVETGADKPVSWAMVTFTLTGQGLVVNRSPLAVDDTASGSENQTLTIDVLANDSDPDPGNMLSLVSAAAPAGKGVATIVNNQLVFNPGASFDYLGAGETASVVVIYVVRDQAGAQSTANVRITITGTNDAPVAVADVAAGKENESLVLDVLANDTDVDAGHVFTLVSAAAPSGQGTVSLSGDKLVFNPGADFDHLAEGATATVMVNYVMRDEAGALSTSTVTITVTGTNDAPVAVADTAAGQQNSDMLLIDVLANDTDVDAGHSFTLVSASVPKEQGAVSIVNGQLAYSTWGTFDHLAEGDTATAVVSYTMRDEHGAQSSSTLAITITGTNDAPVAMPDSAWTDEGKALDINVLANDRDVDDGATLTLTQVSVPAGQGVVTIVNNQLHFDPGSDFDSLGQDDRAYVTVNYQITDEHGATSDSEVTIIVVGTQEGPVARADAVTGGENDKLTIDVLANDGYTGTINLMAEDVPAGKGKVTVSNGALIFSPDSAFDHLAQGDAETVRVNYTVREEASGIESTSYVDITVEGSNDAPVLSHDTAAGQHDAPIVIDVLANDTDVDNGAVLTLIEVRTQHRSGGVARIEDGKVVFDPGTDFSYLGAGESAKVTLSYTVEDEFGERSTSTVEITLTKGAAPGVGDVSGEVTEDGDPDAGTSSIASGSLHFEGLGLVSFPTIATDYGLAKFNAKEENGGLTVNWEFVLNNDLAAVQELRAGETVPVQFEVLGTTVTVSIHGAQDRGKLEGDITGVVEEDGVLNAGGTLTVADVDKGEAILRGFADDSVMSFTRDGNFGLFTFNRDGTWTYALNNDLVQNVREHYSVDDVASVLTLDGSKQQIVVTILGANDEASVVSSRDTVATGNVEEKGVLTAEGRIQFADLDEGEARFKPPLNPKAPIAGSGGYGGFYLNSDGASWRYVLDNDSDKVQALQANEQAQDILRVWSVDRTAYQDLVITITGADSPARISDAAPGSKYLTIEDKQVSTGGALIVSDIDSATAPVFNEATRLQGTYGSFTFVHDPSSADYGHWTYTLDKTNAQLQALNEGQAAFDTLEVSADGEPSYTVRVDIVGSNDLAIIDDAEPGEITEGSGPISGTLVVHDVDSGEASFKLPAPSALVGNYGTFEFQADGSWTYTLNANAETINEGRVVSDSVMVTSADGTATQALTVNVTGVNNKAQLFVDFPAGPFYEDQLGPKGVFGTWKVVDADSNEARFVSIDQDESDGYFLVDKGGLLAFQVLDPQSLREGEVYTHTATIWSLDKTASTTVTATVIGENDEAEFIGTDRIELPASYQFFKFGAIYFDDPDANESGGYEGPDFVADSHGNGSFYFLTNNAGETLWGYAFNEDTQAMRDAMLEGESITEELVIHSRDGTAHTLTIVARGVQDKASFGADGLSGTVFEDGVLNAAGKVTVIDPDRGEAFVRVPTSLAGTYGQFTLTAAGDWTYKLDNTLAAVQGLGTGTQLTDTLTVTSLDGSATTDITVTIEGSNDPLTIAGDTTGHVFEDSRYGTVTGNLRAAGDHAELLSIQGSLQGDYGRFEFDPTTGIWSYTLDNASAAVQALNTGEVRTDKLTLSLPDGGPSQDIVVTIHGRSGDALGRFGLPHTWITAYDAVKDEAGVRTYHSYGTIELVDGLGTVTSAVPAVGAGSHGWGTFTVLADGSWTYSVDDDVVDSIRSAEQTETFEVHTTDGETFNIRVTIAGPDKFVPSMDATAGDDFIYVLGHAYAGPDGVWHPVGEVVDALDGDDHVNGGWGDDQLYGGAGDDTLMGSGGNDYVDGGDGDNTLYGDGSGDPQADGDDTLVGGDGSDRMYGGGGNDELHGGAGFDILFGGSGNDFLNGGSDRDVLFGGDGDDTLRGGSGDDYLFGGAGDDFLDGGEGKNVLYGGEGNDTLVKGPGTTLMFGGDGDDVFEQGSSMMGGGNLGPALLDGGGRHNVMNLGRGSDTILLATRNTDGGWYDTVSGFNRAEDTVIIDTQIFRDLGAADADGHLSGSAWAGTLSFAELIALPATAYGRIGLVTAPSGEVGLFYLPAYRPGAKPEALAIFESLDAAPGRDQIMLSGTHAGSVQEDGNAFALGHLPLSTTYDPQGGDLVHGAFSFDNVTGEWLYTLNNQDPTVNALRSGETLTDSIVVRAQDGTEQTVTITIHGADEKATFGGTWGGFVVEDQLTSASGIVSVVDGDNDEGQDVFKPLGAAELQGQYGVFTFNDVTGEWVYTLNNDQPEVAALRTGDSLRDALVVTSLDGTASRQIVVDIDGSDEAPLIGGHDRAYLSDQTDELTGDSDILDTSGHLVAFSREANQMVAFEEVTNAVGSSGVGHFSVNAQGEWTYDIWRPAVVGADSSTDFTDTYVARTVDGFEHTISVRVNPSESAVTLTGTSGDDVMLPRDGADPDGGAGNDFIMSSTDRARLFGGEGNDYLISRPIGQLWGGEGDDVLIAFGTGRNTIVSGSGNDWIDTSHASADSGNFIVKGTGSDVMVLGDGTDIIYMSDNASFNNSADLILNFDVSKDLFVFEDSLFNDLDNSDLLFLSSMDDWDSQADAAALVVVQSGADQLPSLYAYDQVTQQHHLLAEFGYMNGELSGSNFEFFASSGGPK